MADFRRMARDLVLLDGDVSAQEFEVIRRELMLDGHIDKDELEFLIDIRRRASHVPTGFNDLLFRSLSLIILRDGDISATETEWLRKLILADGKVDEDERKFLTDLRSKAKHRSTEFEAFYQQCMA